MDSSRSSRSLSSGEISPTLAASLRRAANRDRDVDRDEDQEEEEEGEEEEEDIPSSEKSTIEASSEDQEQEQRDNDDDEDDDADKENRAPRSPFPPRNYNWQSPYIALSEAGGEVGFSNMSVTPRTEASVSTDRSVFQPAHPFFQMALNEAFSRRLERERLRLIYYGEDAEEASQYLLRLTPDELRERAYRRHDRMWFVEWLWMFGPSETPTPTGRSDTIPMWRSSPLEEGERVEEDVRIKEGPLEEEVLEGIAEEALEMMAEEEREEMEVQERISETVEVEKEEPDPQGMQEEVPEEVPETQEEQQEEPEEQEEQEEERSPPRTNTSRKRRRGGNASERHAEVAPARRPSTRGRRNTRGGEHEDVDEPVRRSARIRMQASTLSNRGDTRRKQRKQRKKKEQTTTTESNLRRSMRTRKPPDRYVPQPW